MTAQEARDVAENSARYRVLSMIEIAARCGGFGVEVDVPVGGPKGLVDYLKGLGYQADFSSNTRVYVSWSK